MYCWCSNQRRASRTEMDFLPASSFLTLLDIFVYPKLYQLAIYVQFNLMKMDFGTPNSQFSNTLDFTHIQEMGGELKGLKSMTLLLQHPWG